jgi:effector-binding domain-containing protein
LKKHASIIIGPLLAIYHYLDYREKDMDIEVDIPISTALLLPEPVKIRDLYIEAKVASMVHRGPYEKINEA